MYDFAFIQGTPLRQARAMLAEGEDDIRFSIFCYDLLGRLRERHAGQRHCPNCGVLRKSAGPCLNRLQCEDRAEDGDTVLRLSPLNIPEAPLRRPDIFLLLHHAPEIKAALSVRNTEQPGTKARRFRDLFGISSRRTELLQNHRTEV